MISAQMISVLIVVGIFAALFTACIWAFIKE